MASKKDKNSKSSKTAHVLNLITTPAQRQAAAQKQAEEEAAVAQDAAAAVIEAAESAPPIAPIRPLMPPVVEVAHSQDEKIASQIRSALSDELAQLEEEGNAVAAVGAGVPEGPAPVMEPAAVPAEEPAGSDPAGGAEPTPAADAVPAAGTEPTPALDAIPAAGAEPTPASDAIPAAGAEPTPASDAIPATGAEPTPASDAVPAVDPEPTSTADAAHDVRPEPGTVEDAVPIAEPAPVTADPAAAPAEGPVLEAEKPGPAMEAREFRAPARPASAVSSLAPEPPRPDFRGPAPTPQSGSDLLYVNIMQTMVEAMAPRYIKMFGVCKCGRCAADVKALTLTNLAPKYAVFHRRDRIPMLTVYENRYGSLIAAQLTKACSIVKINPHHR